MLSFSNKFKSIGRIIANPKTNMVSAYPIMRPQISGLVVRRFSINDLNQDSLEYLA